MSMSEQTPRDFDTSIPTVEEAALYWQWGGREWRAPERFDRMIAKVKADALREAATENFGLMRAMGREDPAETAQWLRTRADRIEGEA